MKKRSRKKQNFEGDKDLSLENGETRAGRELGHQCLFDMESQASPNRTTGPLASSPGRLTACPFNHRERDLRGFFFVFVF